MITLHVGDFVSKFAISTELFALNAKVLLVTQTRKCFLKLFLFLKELVSKHHPKENRRVLSFFSLK
jgi:hypothetical protein